VPALTLIAITAGTIVVSVAFGVAAAGALALIAVLVVPVVTIAVLAAAMAARRGGRVSDEVLIRMLGADPSSPVSATMIVLWLAPWLILTLIALGGVFTIVGHAVAHHRSVIDAGVIAFSITAAVAGALLATARRTIRPH
jgi:hypothetical protein